MSSSLDNVSDQLAVPKKYVYWGDYRTRKVNCRCRSRIIGTGIRRFEYGAWEVYI